MWHRIAAFALAPLLWMQGRGVRRRTPRLPEAAGPRAGSAGDGPLLGLLIIGDSAAAGVGARTQREALAGQLVSALARRFRVQWRLVAKTGVSTADVISHLATRLEAAPCDVVVVSLGVNDVTTGTGHRAWLVLQHRLVALLRARFTPRLILLSGLPPMHAFPALPQPLRWYLGARARDLDARLAAWTLTQPDCRHVPYAGTLDPAHAAPDGFHPGPVIYRLWAETLAAQVRTAWGIAAPGAATGAPWRAAQ
jgi:lysophospholipase L1-like esterase